jgi:hypothetical protein
MQRVTKGLGATMIGTDPLGALLKGDRVAAAGAASRRPPRAPVRIAIREPASTLTISTQTTNARSAAKGNGGMALAIAATSASQPSNLGSAPVQAIAIPYPVRNATAPTSSGVEVVANHVQRVRRGGADSRGHVDKGGARRGYHGKADSHHDGPSKPPGGRPDGARAGTQVGARHRSEEQDQAGAEPQKYALAFWEPR